MAKEVKQLGMRAFQDISLRELFQPLAQFLLSLAVRIDGVEQPVFEFLTNDRGHSQHIAAALIEAIYAAHDHPVDRFWNLDLIKIRSGVVSTGLGIQGQIIFNERVGYLFDKERVAVRFVQDQSLEMFRHLGRGGQEDFQQAQAGLIGKLLEGESCVIG